MSIFENVKCDDTVFAKLITEIANSKSKGQGSKSSFPKELIMKCVEYVESTKNMTRAKFAERTGLSYSTIQSWMNKFGKSDIRNYTPPASIAPIPVTQMQSIFGDKKPVSVKEIVKDLPSLFTPIPTEALKPVAKEKEKSNALIRTPDGLEIELPIAYLASFLKTLKE